MQNPGQIFGGDMSIFNHNFRTLAPGPSQQLSPPSWAYLSNVVPPPTSPIVDPRVVEFLFASTRRGNSSVSSGNINYNGERAPLTFGAASVRIPDDHKIGPHRAAGSWNFFG